jgi:hypothetical protein
MRVEVVCQAVIATRYSLPCLHRRVVSNVWAAGCHRHDKLFIQFKQTSKAAENEIRSTLGNNCSVGL